MTNPINRVAKAYVEITADYDKFRDEATRKINAAFRDIGADLNTSPVTHKIGEGGKDAGDLFVKEFDKAVANELRSSTRQAIAVIGNEVNNGPNRSFLRRAFTDVARNAAVGFGVGLAGILGGGEGIGRFFETLKAGGSVLSGIFDSLGSGFGQFLIKAGLGIIIIPHLAAVILVLIANLTSLAGLLNALPGLAAVAVGAIIPLVLAFQNFGDAISAVMEGDPEKIAKAMDKLAPAARSVVKEFSDLLPVFRNIQRITQQGLFGPLQGVLTEVIKNIGQEKIAQGLFNAADAWGKFLAMLLRIGETPAFQQLAYTLFGDATTAGLIAKALDSIGAPLSRLLQAFADAAVKSGPLLEKLFDSFGTMLDNFGDFIEGAVQDGSFNRFLEQALQTTKDLFGLVGALLQLFYDIFQATDDGGERFLQKVTDAIDKLDAFFKSEDGKRAMEAMISLAESFATALGVAADILAKILNFMGRLNEISGGHLPGSALTGTGPAINNLLKQAGLPHFASGSVVKRPTFALVGEAGPEAVVPLGDPARARAVMDEAGLLPLAGAMSGAGSVTVHVYLGNEEFYGVVDTRVERGLAQSGAALRRGPRGM